MKDGDINIIIGLLSLIVSIVFAGLIWLIKKQFEQSNTTIKEANKANKALADSIDKLTDATQKQSESLNARDKRDHDFQKEVMASFGKIIKTQDKIIKTQDRNYNAVKSQVVKIQTVDKQIVSKK